MPFQILHQDITAMRTDAIVNTTNKTMTPGMGVNGAVLRAGGSELIAKCRELGGCSVGQVQITRGYQLPCRYVLHTVTPTWQDGCSGEMQLLRYCYENALQQAKSLGCRSIAFPLLSAGAHGFPEGMAMEIAIEVIRSFLNNAEEEMTVFLAIMDREKYRISRRLLDGVESYLLRSCEPIVEAACYAAMEPSAPKKERPRSGFGMKYGGALLERRRRAQKEIREERKEGACPTAPCSPMSLEDALDTLDESFSQAVTRLIQEKGMKNSDCYKRANIDKKHFSKIHNDIHYHPKKSTALALAIALELNLEQTQLLLKKAGLTLSHSSKFDIIVEYFILQGNYDIFEINETLFYYDQELLGNVAA